MTEGILATLRAPRGVPGGLQHYSTEKFAERVSRIVDDVLLARAS